VTAWAAVRRVESPSWRDCGCRYDWVCEGNYDLVGVRVGIPHITPPSCRLRALLFCHSTCGVHPICSGTRSIAGNNRRGQAGIEYLIEGESISLPMSSSLCCSHSTTRRQGCVDFFSFIQLPEFTHIRLI